MSLHPQSLSQRRIVNTSSSGVVTIIIDDDNVSETVPKPSFVSQSVTPSVVGLRTASLVSVQTPKFIRSDTQTSLVSSNDKKLIVVKKTPNAMNGELCPSLSCSLPSTLSQSRVFMSPQLKPHNTCKPQATHTTTTQTPNHVLVSTRQTYPSYSPAIVSSMQSVSQPSQSVSVSSHSQPSHSYSHSSQVSKTSPHKYRLWHQQNASITHNKNNSNNNNNSNSNNNFDNTYSRYSSQSTSDQQSRAQHKEKVLPPEDTESDCMDDQTYFKYLNLISKSTLSREENTELCAKWPLRNISKGAVPCVSNGCIVLPNLKMIQTPVVTTPDLTQHFLERRHRWYREAQQYNERLNRFKSNMPLNQANKDKLQTDLEILHKRLMTEKSQLSEEEERYRAIKQSDSKRKSQNSELEGYFTLLDYSSPLGQRVLNSVTKNPLSPHDVYIRHIKTYENYCLPSKEVSSLNVPQTKLTTRLTRSNTGFAGVDKMWGPRGYSHEYCFSREQRLEKYMRLNTGLDWKSRLLSLQCKSVNVGLEKITRCPCCLELVEPEWGHSCHDFDSDSAKIEEYNHSSDANSDIVMKVDESEDYSMDSEIITAGMTCWKCGSDECTGDMCSGDNSSPAKLANRIDNPILVFTTKDTILPLKQVVDDKIMVQQVKSCLYKTVQQKSDSEPKMRYIDNNENRNVCDDNDNDDNEDDDIVIIQEVCSRSHQRNTNIDNKIINTPPIIMRYATDSSEKSPLIKRYCESSPLVNRSPKGSAKSSDVIVVKKI